jgi:GT2 family glycosyltransferase
MDVPPAAPPVVAVIVTCDPGRWLEDCIRTLRAQDYPNLSVLVIDAASAEDPTPRLAGVMPSAFVRRLPRRSGFAAAANEVLEVVQGASHYLFCHDDIVLAPDATRMLVEEAFRSNAGIVSPKFVDVDDPERLLAAGTSADKGGVLVDLVERGELDQEQHDAVREVFAAPAGCMLVRADLFATLGGFDPAMCLAGEELDLSWRAQVAGARVIVAPAAVVRHREVTLRGWRGVDGALNGDVHVIGERVAGRVSAGRVTEGRVTAGRVIGGRPLPAVAASGSGVGVDDTLAGARETARLRAVVKNYGIWQLARILPQLLLITMAQAVASLMTGHLRQARSVVRPWWNTLVSLPGLWRPRRAVRRVRTVSDRELRGRQSRGHARIQAGMARVVHRPPELDPAAAAGAYSWRTDLGFMATVGVALVAVIGFGSRHVVGGHLPLVAGLIRFPSPTALWRELTSGWRGTGLGSSSPAPTALALLAGAGTVVGGHMGLLQRLLVLGLVPVGGAGAYHLAAGFGLGRARWVTVVAYVANPLPYDALANGHWAGLVAYGGLPWIVAVLVRTSHLPPFARSPGKVGAAVGNAVASGSGFGALSLGLVLAVAGAFVPALVPLTVLVAVLMGLGSVIAGGVRVLWRPLVLALVGGAIAVVLLLPWSAEYFSLHGGWAMLAGATGAPGHGLAIGSLLRFQTGPVGAGPLGWGLLVVAALPLVIGGSWRWAWAVRLWAVALGGWALVWVGRRGWLGLALPDPEVILAAALVALALCAGLGAAAFVTDLRGYHFGWRQVVSSLAAVTAVLAVLPVVGAAANGRWYLPARGVDSVLSWLPTNAGGDYRVLWLGDPAVLPIPGWSLRPGLAYATSNNGLPDATVAWPGPASAATARLADAVELAERHQTGDLGRLLAPMAVRYVVVVTRGAPSPEQAPVRAVAPSLLDGLASQIDLGRVDSDPSVTVYQNNDWVPIRSTLPPSAGPIVAGDLLAARRADLSGATPALARSSSPTTSQGQAQAGGRLLLAEAPSGRWVLTVNGRQAQRSAAFGVANLFVTPRSGTAVLHYQRDPGAAMSLALEGGAWFVAVAALLVLWRRRRRPAVDGRDEPPPTPVAVATPSVLAEPGHEPGQLMDSVRS